jgi:hypothetical protein
VYYSQPAVTRVVRTEVVAPEPPVVITKVAKVERTIVIKPSLPEIEVGSEVKASANFLGAEEGFVLIQLGGATLQADIVEWTASSVTFKAPSLGLKSGASARLELVRPDGQIVRSFDVRLTPPPALLVRTNIDGDASNPAIAVEGRRTADAGGLVLESSVSPEVALTAN